MGAISADKVNGRCKRNPSTQKEANPPNILNTLPQNHPLIRLDNTPIPPSPCCPPPPGPPSSPESFLISVQAVRTVVQPIRSRIKTIQYAVHGIDCCPARCEQRVWVWETVGHDPAPAWGKGGCPLRFRLDLLRDISLGSGFKMEDGNKERNSTHNVRRDSTRRGRNGWRKRKGMAKNKKTHPQHPTYTPESTSQVY